MDLQGINIKSPSARDPYYEVTVLHRENGICRKVFLRTEREARHAIETAVSDTRRSLGGEND